MSYSFQDNGVRSKMLAQVRRIVIKVGTRLLVNAENLNTSKQLADLLSAVKTLRDRGIEVILVSSGAIGTGMKALKVSKRPSEIAKLQAYAAVGQMLLMQKYDEEANKLGFNCAQLLVTAADFHAVERNRHFARCLEALLADGILPIINENDSVCTDEIKVGDNDTLAAYVAAISDADITLLLTTIDGLREVKDGGELGQRISVVKHLEKVYSMAKGTDGNEFSTGGMVTKLNAASIVNKIGKYLIVAGDSGFELIDRIFTGEDLGTVFAPEDGQYIPSGKRFLAFFSEPTGTLLIDDNAVKSLVEKESSLLPSGILGTRGLFQRKEFVSIVNRDNKEIARGITNFAYDEIAKICGAKPSQLAKILDREISSPEVVNRDYMVLLKD